MAVLYSFNLVIFFSTTLTFFLGIKFILLLIFLTKGLFYLIIAILVIFTIILVLLLVGAKEDPNKIFIIIINSL